ncbi:LOW QUALITY PROTEIN: SIN3-HDAC complex-associated factor-like [Ctenocephalides felis]|uniref:LOW QUALITY PROTEIN: SIN3-HDAC complex-associated factor-like n=1 Tax=Ctenocephalides felis TaxID=7515 RepID=UPI000E6E453F|nr:LOW QUALITY PROTEIN: SIN3-HDAC complex-associated factor-like [Ctenocephalides felis]
MFSFHKPKVYRSPTGCCICKAKSSSSRFTDSRKYEDDFVECFQLPSPRKGEICNACVLLVKRFKRLPPGSDRHWGHVVDARVGPGLKSMTRFKKKKEEKELAANCVGFNNTNAPPEKFLKIMKKKSKKERKSANAQKNRENSPTPSDDSTPGSPLSYHSDADDNLSDVDCNTNQQLAEDENSAVVQNGKENNAQNNIVRQRRKSHKPPSKRKAGPPDSGGFLQPDIGLV